MAGPEGRRPGFLRVDTVHQGDLDGNKGVYLINAVDEVTQFEFAGAVTFVLGWTQRRGAHRARRVKAGACPVSAPKKLRTFRPAPYSIQRPGVLPND